MTRIKEFFGAAEAAPFQNESYAKFFSIPLGVKDRHRPGMAHDRSRRFGCERNRRSGAGGNRRVELWVTSDCKVRFSVSARRSYRLLGVRKNSLAHTRSPSLEAHLPPPESRFLPLPPLSRGCAPAPQWCERLPYCRH